MRIAILGQSYPPRISGAAIFTCHLAEALAQRGHEVMVLAPSDQGKAYCQQRGHLTIQRLTSSTSPGRMKQHFLLWPANEIQAALRAFNPEVLHLHDPFQLSYFAKDYARRTGVPCILTIHALPALVSTLVPETLHLRQAVEKGLWKYAAWLSGQFDVEVTSTETISRMIEERTGVRPLVVSGGVDMQTFHPASPRSQLAACLRDELGIQAGAQIILHVGRLDAGKNVQAVIRAAGLTIRALSPKDVHLLCVGDGCEKPQLVKLAQELGIADRCHFPGLIADPERLAAIYGMADLFCMASEIETQGLVMLEAAACGLPFVAVDATSIPEIVSHGVNGFLVPAGKVENMAKGMTAILQDPSLSKKMRAASRLASLAHDFNRTVDGYESIYRSAVMNRVIQKTSKDALVNQAAILGKGI